MSLVLSEMKNTVFRETPKRRKFGKKCLVRLELRQKLPKLARRRMATSEEFGRGSGFSSMTTTKTGGVGAEVVKRRRSATLAGRIRKCSMILAQSCKTRTNMVWHIQLRMGRGLWKSATRYLCNIGAKKMVVLRNLRRKMWILARD